MALKAGCRFWLGEEVPLEAPRARGSPFRIPAERGSQSCSPPLNQKRELGRRALARTTCSNPHPTPGENFTVLPGQSCNPKPGVPVLGGGLLLTKTRFHRVKEKHKGSGRETGASQHPTQVERDIAKKQPKREDTGSGSALTSACFVPSFETFTKDSSLSLSLSLPFLEQKGPSPSRICVPEICDQYLEHLFFSQEPVPCKRRVP